MATGQRTSKPSTKSFLDNLAVSEPQEDITDPPHAPHFKGESTDALGGELTYTWSHC